MCAFGTTIGSKYSIAYLFCILMSCNALFYNHHCMSFNTKWQENSVAEFINVIFQYIIVLIVWSRTISCIVCDSNKWNNKSVHTYACYVDKKFCCDCKVIVLPNKRTYTSNCKIKYSNILY